MIHEQKKIQAFIMRLYSVISCEIQKIGHPLQEFTIFLNIDQDPISNDLQASRLKWDWQIS